MKQQTITFSSMNSDISDKFMKNGMYKKMINCRANNLNSGSGGVVETINSNLPISTLSFGETVEYIGGCQDYKRNAIIGFYKGIGTLFITSYSVDAKAESFLLKSTHIDFSERVTHSGVLDDYLFWIDGAKKLRKFNITEANATLNYFNQADLLIDKVPPLFPPTVVASYDNTHIGNTIQNTVFQYAYSYKYSDGEQSSWSPISKSKMPASNSNEDKAFPNNLHTVTLETGGSKVSKILIAARKGETRDFLLIDTLDKEEEGIGNDTTYDYKFYNNKSTLGLTQADVLSNTFNPFYSFNTMAIANDNFLALGGIKDSLENTDVTLSLIYSIASSTGRGQAYKMGSTHGFGLVFRDENGRTAGVCAQTSIEIPSITELKALGQVTGTNQYAKVSWSVTGSAPTWAKTVSLVYLGSTSKSYWIQHLIGDIYDRQTFTYIDISPLNLASQQGSTTDITASEIDIEPYVWQKGDRIHIYTDKNQSLLSAEYDFQVQGYVPTRVDAGGNTLFKETIYVDKFDWASVDIDEYSQFEIYRPKKEFTDEIFYETGNVYEVINGAFVTSSGIIDDGDAWHRERSHDTREIADFQTPTDWSLSVYQREDIIVDLSAIGETEGIQNTNGTAPFYIAPDDVEVTISGTFRYTAQWDKDYSDPAIRFVYFHTVAGFPVSTYIEIPYSKESITPTESWLEAAVFTGDISLEGFAMKKGETLKLVIVVFNKHRVQIIEGSDINFRLLVQNAENQSVDFYVEDISYSDYFDSNEHSKGRPYTELEDQDASRVLNDICTTGKYFADTDIDETNKIDSDVTHIPYMYGNITALRVVGNVLKCLCPSKEISIYLGREEYLDGAGNTQTALSTAKLGRIRVPDSDYGTTNPESILVSGRSMYYYDLKNACVVASNPNGQVDIGVYGYKTFLRQITSLLSDATLSEVHMGYNDKNTEVLITFVYDGNSDTVVFNERDNLWTHHLDNTNAAGNPSQGMMHIGESLLVYLGKPYLHEQGSDKLNFFGDAKTATIVGVINQEPISTKILQSMNYQSTDKWDVSIESEKMEGWPLGQYTEIPAGRQVYKEGIIYSDITYNLRRKDGTTNKLFYAKGTPMRARTVRFTMTNSNTNPVQLDEFSVMYINSPTQ